ncbi:hypothetical protein QWZ13_14640 [Reinekea marina]|uniref:Uncharacterized protein n=1 Tax=Reinekea marina TaxID=1310421 RepID=A0ABV7WWN9_9GAMM|nr:hypothetical protein [Reinekea marina]MDN3650155.1 hypothetical protein [Reinekea marina]
MTKEGLLECALYSSASIHQPHALKAFLAASFLQTAFEQNDAIWSQVSKLISKSELTVTGEFSVQVEAPKFSQVRIARILQSGIYPAAYQAMWQWHEQKGFESIFEFYADLASKQSDTLSHNITILLAFKCMYPLLKSGQIPVFLNRMTEFVTSTYYIHSSFPISRNSKEISLSTLLDACLKQPHFFGHNLISLAWLIRSKETFTPTQLAQIYLHLYNQATLPLEDPEDMLDESILKSLESSSATFQQNINALIFDDCINLHQVTLADALVLLEKEFPSHSNEINKIAKYFAVWLKN